MNIARFAQRRLTVRRDRVWGHTELRHRTHRHVEKFGVGRLNADVCTIRRREAGADMNPREGIANERFTRSQMTIEAEMSKFVSCGCDEVDAASGRCLFEFAQQLEPERDPTATLGGTSPSSATRRHDHERREFRPHAHDLDKNIRGCRLDTLRVGHDSHARARLPGSLQRFPGFTRKL